MDFNFVMESLPRLLPGLWLTIQISLLGLTLAALIGLPLGVYRAAGSIGFWTRLVDLYVFVVRGTPILVQVYAAYFLIPITGLSLSPFWTGIVALLFNSAGYQIEISRAAVLSIDQGQDDAAKAFGMRPWFIMRLVILPQAVPRMLPALANEASNLVKASSVLSVIAVFELHKAANAIISQSYKFLEMLAAQAVLYVAFVTLLTQLAIWLERRTGGYMQGQGDIR